MGVARKARLIGVKVVDCDMTTDVATVLQGISYIEGNYHGGHVSRRSRGHVSRRSRGHV